MNVAIDNQTMTAFWLVIGSLVLSNIGLVINAVYSHIKKVNKVCTDMDAAHKKIRYLESKNLTRRKK